MLKVRVISGVPVVVDSALDGVAYDAFGMQAAAHRVGFHPNPNQIIAPKAVQSVVPTDSHVSILRSLRKKFLGGGMGVFAGGFAISTMFLGGENVVSCGETRGKTWSVRRHFCGS